MPTKLVVTDVSAMKRKYKASWPKVRQAVGRLARKDAARGITTTLVALDGADLGASRAKARQPETFKAAIDHLWGLHHQPDYILILGGPDIVPHQSLRNTVPPDDDPDIPSDLPYACEAPVSRDPSTFIAPTRVVGFTAYQRPPPMRIIRLVSLSLTLCVPMNGRVTSVFIDT